MANAYRSVLASSGPAPTGGDALPAEVLAGKTFTNDNGSQTGTMVNRGAVSQTIQPGGSYTIPEGYHNGSGTVSASSMSVDLVIDETSATGDYTFSDDCEVLIINTQLDASNIKINNVAITVSEIPSNVFRYTASKTYKYVGHISSGSVLSMTTSNFAAELYMVTT